MLYGEVAVGICVCSSAVHEVSARQFDYILI